QYLFFYKTFGPRIHHPLLDPNNMAALMNMGLLSAAGFYMTAVTPRQSGWRLALAALFWAALMATQSRSGIFCAVAGLAVLLPFTALPLRERGLKLAALA